MSTMKLTFIGVGGAFTMKNWQSNMLFETSLPTMTPGVNVHDSNGEVVRRMLLDCGGDARFALAALGLGAKDIDAVYISHCHADHVGGLEWLGFSRYFSPGTKPDLYINERLAGQLWNDSLRGGMASQGVILTLDSFFRQVFRVPKNDSFRWQNRKFQPIQTVHYMDGYEIVPSYGLLVSNPNNKDAGEAFITTDTQFCPRQIEDFYKRAYIIFQDCETYDLTGNIRSGVHAHYLDLKTLPAETKAKMWLYHYSDGELPDAVADGFAGFIQKGQSFDL